MEEWYIIEFRVIEIESPTTVTVLCKSWDYGGSILFQQVELWIILNRIGGNWKLEMEV
jgi:hypothetical protein